MKSRLCCGVTDDRIKAVELARLTAAFLQQGQDQVSADLRVEAYFAALDGLPAWAVSEARQRVVNGETAYGRPWGPGPVEFADLVRGVLRPLADDLRDVRTLLRAEAQEIAPPPEEYARVSLGFDDLRASFGGRGTAHHEHEDALSGLARRARENGLELETALAGIPDAKERAGTFRRLSR